MAASRDDMTANELRTRVAEIYGPFLEASSLTTAATRRIRNLLVERLRSLQDVEELSKDKRLESCDTAVAEWEAEEPIDREIAVVGGERIAAELRKIYEVQPQLEQINDGIGGEMARAGSPLIPSQALNLAEVLKEAYAVPSLPSDGFDRRMVGYDPASGLSALDRQIMTRVGNFLSPAQWLILQRNLADLTTQYTAASR